MTVYLFSQGPFTVSMAAQIDFEKLRKSGHRIEILEGTRLLFPDLEGQHGEESLEIPSTKLRDATHLAEISSKLLPKDWVLFWGGCFDSQIQMPDSPYRVLCTSEARLGAINASHSPFYDIGFIRLLILKLRFEPASVFKSVSRRIKGRISRREDQWFAGDRAELRPLDHVWAGTMLSPLSAAVLGPKTSVTYLHSLDAEIMRNLEFSDNGSIVVLDSMGPLHPDQKITGGNSGVSADEYFLNIVKGLKAVAKSSDCKIVIAAHPRAIPGSLDKYYAPFEVIYHATSELISKASGVIDVSNSTAVGMAVLARKPIMYLTPRKLEKSITLRVQKIWADGLGAARYDIDYLPLVLKFEPIDSKKYNDFLERYVARGTIPYQDFWSVIASQIANPV